MSQPPSTSPQGPISTISNSRTLNMTDDYMARRKSSDINQILTYRKVMERVIKRFLLHKQREEQDEVREGDFEALKQDIQMLRFEMANRLDETRDNLARNSLLLNEGVLVVGELLSSFTHETSPFIRENFHLFKKNFHSTFDKIGSIDSGMESSEIVTESNTPSIPNTTSIPNIINYINSTQALPTSHSEPLLSSNDHCESGINAVQAVKCLSVAHATLSNIAEEDGTVDKNENEKVKDEEEKTEEEFEARHVSIQTSADDEDAKAETL